MADTTGALAVGSAPDDDVGAANDAFSSDAGAGAGAGVGAGAGASGALLDSDSESGSDDVHELREWMGEWPGLLKQFDLLCSQLRRRQIVGSSATARITAEFLRNVVAKGSGTTLSMIDHVKQIGRQLVAAQRLDLVIGNMVRRVLFEIRQAMRSARKGTTDEDGDMAPPPDAGHGKSLQTIMDKRDGDELGNPPFKELRPLVMDGVVELLMELENSRIPITRQAPLHIHANEVILTCGNSGTLVEFLKAALRKNKHQSFEVIVCESAPLFLGHATAAALSSAGIMVTVISDAAVFAMMARVDKVLIGCHAVVANGGLITQSGAHAVAIAAKHHKVPVVCVTGMYKLCPLYPHDQDTVNELLSPTMVLKFEEADTVNPVDVVNPQFDYVPPKLVDLLVTNLYGLQPSYVYRLLAVHYDPEDYEL